MTGKDLKDYLASIGMTIKDFCHIIDCNEKHMSRIINGHLPAGARLAKEVYQATSGKVKLKTSVRKKHLKKEKKDRQQQRK